MKTDHEQPAHGGSYIRHDDGSLKLVDGPETTKAALKALAHEKPAASKPKTGK